MTELLIGNILADAALLRPDATAMTLGDRSLTFAEIDGRCNRTARALADLGVDEGAVVAWWSHTSLRAPDLFFACARLGAPCAPLNPDLPEADVGGILDYLRPRLFVVDAAHLEAGRRAADSRGIPVAVAGLADDPAPGTAFGAGSGAAADGTTAGERPTTPLPAVVDLDALTELAGSGPLDAPPALDDGQPHVIYLTSGTTGRPKGVVVSHRASWLRSSAAGGTFGTPWPYDSGMVTCFPLFHYSGWHYVMEAWQNRVPVHQPQRASAEEMIAVVERWRPAGLYCIPAVWERILAPEHQAADLSSLRRADTGTSPTSTDLIGRIRRRLPGVAVGVMYGSTEAGHTTTLADWDVTRKPGSVGRAAPPSLVRVDERGEILVGGPTLMNGYLDLPEQTAEALAGGWYHTGDLGSFDDEGFLTITGRSRDIISTGGESVAPSHVESVLRDHPAIADLAVVGLPDDRFGEIICVVLVLDVDADGGPHDPPTVESLRAHVADRLPSHAHPRQVAIVSSLPRTGATGQVQRARVREALLQGELSAPE